MMKCTLAFVLAFCSLAAAANNNAPLERFYDSLADSSLELSYSCTARVSGVLNKAEGSLISQGHMWEVTIGGVEMYCDSTTLWVVDPAMKEVVLEPASTGTSSAFVENPALMLSGLRDNFNVSVSRLLQDGQTLLYTLRPKSENGVEYFNVELDMYSALLRRASFAMTDGTLVKIEVSSMKLTPKVSVEAFRPSTVFDSQWIVTDLR